MIATFTLGGVAINSVVASQVEAPFSTTYELGETVIVPKRNISVGGVSVSATPVVIYPDGSAYSVSNVKLSDPGKYTVEYRANVGGRTYKESHSFTVLYPMNTLTARSDSATYGKVDGFDVEGLKVKIANGSTYTLNQVIDLNEMKKGDPLLSFYVLPETFGAMDAEYLYIKLSDAIDPSNFVTIQFRQSPYADNVLYVSAKAHNQPTFYGVEWGLVDGQPIDGYHGFAANGSFTGANFGNERHKLTVFYDNATQTVNLTNTAISFGGNYVIDFNNTKCFAEGWRGFESGKINVSMYGGTYSKNSMSFVLTSVAQTDLTQKYINVDSTSEITVDYGEYTENDYPSAVLNKPYKIFDASSLNTYTKEKIEVSVYTGYGSTTALNVDVVNGEFIPTRLLTHTIVYKCTDGFGNVGYKTVPVNVLADFEPIVMEVDQSDISCMIGQTLTLPAITSLHGGNGTIKTQVTLKKVGETESVVINGNKYRFLEQGEYLLIYTATDYNQCSIEKSISVTVGPANAPIFSDDPFLPITYIKGGKYLVPELKAEDFASGSRDIIDTVVTVLADGSTVLPVVNGYFTANAQNKITLKYTATDELDRSSTISYDVSVTDTNLGDIPDTEKYFIANGGYTKKVVVRENNRTYSDYYLIANAEKATFKFIKELNGRTFNSSFLIQAGKNNFSSVRYTIVDYKDVTKVIDLLVEKVGDKAFISINGAKSIETKTLFGGDVKAFNIELEGNLLNFCNNVFRLKNYRDGQEFNGFNDFVYLTISLEGVTDVNNAEIKLDLINNQAMSMYLRSQIIRPAVMFMGAFGGEQEINNVMRISPVLSTSVLDPYTEISFSVKMPDGITYAVSQDGITLKDVPSDRAYDLLMSEYGKYTFTYKSCDSRGDVRPITYNVNCLDKVKPEIKVTENTVSGEVGKALSVPKYKVSDNYSKPVVVIQIINPEGIITTYEKGYKPTMKGKHVIRYMVMDENYNVIIKDVICNVK